MSKPPIYPKGYDAEFILAVNTPGHSIVSKWGGITHWPTMLGLLTIIGDAVRGVPWGHGECVPEPWQIEDGHMYLVNGRNPELVEGTPVWIKPCWGEAHPHYGQLAELIVAGSDKIQHVNPGAVGDNFTPATVIPTDEYQAMRERLDGISGLEKRYSELRARAAKLEAEAEWLSKGSEAISESIANCTVIPTPTADGWIDPADRLPEVGEWMWTLADGAIGTCTWGEAEQEMYASARQRMIARSDLLDYAWRWAPILFGPPPVPPGAHGPPPDGSQVKP